MFSKWVEWQLVWEEKGGWLRRYLLKIPKLPFFHHFNFILLHYVYLVFLVILGSVLLYGVGGMQYIDALFFASGAATQSGLNTVDLNTILLSQQVFLILIACIANPIWINGMVVFIRLYWFEKRFQKVVRDARTFRRTRTKSRTKSEMKQDLDHDGEERGVGGREIRVLRSPNGDANMNGKKNEDESDSDIAMQGQARGSKMRPGLQSLQTNGHGSPKQTPTSPIAETPSTFQREIVFADEVHPTRNRRRSSAERLPQQRTREQNIAFLERQRQEKAKIRVPGPRDFDRGEMPHKVDDDEEGNMGRSASVDEAHREKQISPGDANELNLDDHPLKSESDSEPHKPSRHLTWLPNVSTVLLPRRSREGGEEDSEMHLRKRGRLGTFNSFLSGRSVEKDRDPIPYLSYAPTIGRNSLFIDLTEDQREELGGVEYRALKTLAWVVTIYYFGFHILGVVCLVPWILHSSYKHIPVEDGQSPTWWGIWTPMSLFTDLGFTITPDSMVSFQRAVWPLLLGSFLIVIGNTGFPCMLRFVIWLASKMVTYGTPLYEELQFLLDHPRRCFTLLFPKQATWWLFGILVLLNAIDLIFFIILDLKDPTVTILPGGIRFLDGLFQAFSTRTAGFSVVNLADLHPGIQVSYLIMMYISVFPIAISVRRTNVYEEKSLGVYGSQQDENENEEEQSYIGAHLRRQLSFDLWYVFLGLFIICIVEGDRLQNTNEYAFTIFSVLFEIVSAYGTVGLSLGYPGINASFSTEFRVLSKLVIIAMQLRGRHRGLPYALDRAILLPSESLQRKEAEAARRARERRPSAALDVEGSGAPLVGQRSRRNSTGTVDHDRKQSIIDFAQLSRQRTGLKRVLSGALSAGPSGRKDRKKVS